MPFNGLALPPPAGRKLGHGQVWRCVHDADFDGLRYLWRFCGMTFRSGAKGQFMLNCNRTSFQIRR
jgi:hypothetical protein